jgi:PncC family amidohydrolase
MFDDECLAIAARIGAVLTERGQRLAIAETTAGGLISAHLLAIPGASKWFDRGVVAYTGTSKTDSLGVDPAVLKEHGSVSSEAVSAMAEGVMRLANAQYAVAESGLAGPIQGRSPKGIGTVWLAVTGPDGTASERQQFEGDRAEVMPQITRRALELIAGAVGA